MYIQSFIFPTVSEYQQNMSKKPETSSILDKIVNNIEKFEP